MIRKIVHYTDSLLTQDLARQYLPAIGMVVAWYTNKENVCSVVHSHPYYEMILPMTGEVLYSCNGSLFHIHSGELIIFPDEVYHMGRYDVAPESSERLLLQIDRDLLKNVANAIGLEGFLTTPEPTIFKSSVISSWDIRGLFIRMSRASILPPDHRDTILRCQLAELLLILHACMSNKNTISPDATSELVDKAQKFMQLQYVDPKFSVNMLAEHLHVSRSHISRVFREYTMESIHGYLTGLRLQHFKLTLAEGKSILDASMESGFSDYSSFLKTFRKTYGITPNEYRKKLTHSPGENTVDGATLLDMDSLPAPIDNR